MLGQLRRVWRHGGYGKALIVTSALILITLSLAVAALVWEAGGGS